MKVLKGWMALAVVTVAGMAAIGALAGYFIGRELSLQLAEANVTNVATNRIADSVAYSRDSHTVLDAMNSSKEPFCSEEDLQTMERLLYHSHLLKEVGRLKDNKIACSTSMGRSDLAATELPKPTFVGPDGVKVYYNPPVWKLNYVTVVVLQASDSYVVLNPYINSLRDVYKVHVQHTVIDEAQAQHSRQLASTPDLTGPILTRDQNFRIGDIFYATRCSPQYFTCMTASQSLSEALSANQIQYRDSIKLGTIAGGLLGFLLSLLYRRNRGLEFQLRRAIRRDALRVFYQPVVQLGSGRIVGAEALARWTDEDGLAVWPEVFIKIAEERGFVRSITQLVIRHVLSEFSKTFLAHPEFSVNINVTVSDLSDPDFPDMLETALDQARVHARCLGIEITESASARLQPVIETIVLLRRRGHHVYIDDFGTGYSSLSYLHDLSIDGIKIDKTFTHAIGTEAVTVGILPQVMAMADALNLQVVVEGVETERQAAFFATAAKPILAQGWIFGYPMPAMEFLRAMAENAQKSTAARLHPPVHIRGNASSETSAGGDRAGTIQ